MKNLKLLLLVVLLSLPAAAAFSVTDEEIFRTFSLNLATPGARAIGMGGAFIGLADDATAAETNPAGLTVLARPEVSFQYRYANGRSVSTNLVNVPLVNLDGTPTFPVPDEYLPTTAQFSANDRLAAVNELSFASVVWPLERVTFAFSRHELINTDAFLGGSISASPFHYVEQNSFEGQAIISDTNYSLSAAIKILDQVSLGGSVKFSDFDFESAIAARQKQQSQFGHHFTSVIDTNDSKIGFNAGIMVRPHPKFSVGAVYRFEPEFVLDTVVHNVDRTVGGHPAPQVVNRPVDFDIPDSFGVGISASPVPNLRLNLDVVRVLHSQLGEVVTGFSLFTHLLPVANDANIIDFKIDDGTDVHVGSEYLVESGDWVHAFRGGYYRQARNRFYLGAARNADVNAFLLPIFGKNPGNDIAHWTIGFGTTYRNFQIDLAADLSQKDDVASRDREELADGGFDFVISSVLRF